jgi:hypothetical protein
LPLLLSFCRLVFSSVFFLSFFRFRLLHFPFTSSAEMINQNFCSEDSSTCLIHSCFQSPPAISSEHLFHPVMMRAADCRPADQAARGLCVCASHDCERAIPTPVCPGIPPSHSIELIYAFPDVPVFKFFDQKIKKTPSKPERAQKVLVFPRFCVGPTRACSLW